MGSGVKQLPSLVLYFNPAILRAAPPFPAHNPRQHPNLLFVHPNPFGSGWRLSWHREKRPGVGTRAGRPQLLLAGSPPPCWLPRGVRGRHSQPCVQRALPAAFPQPCPDPGPLPCSRPGTWRGAGEVYPCWEGNVAVPDLAAVRAQPREGQAVSGYHSNEDTAAPQRAALGDRPGSRDSPWLPTQPKASARWAGLHLMIQEQFKHWGPSTTPRVGGRLCTGAPAGSELGAELAPGSCEDKSRAEKRQHCSTGPFTSGQCPDTGL